MSQNLFEAMGVPPEEAERLQADLTEELLKIRECERQAWIAAANVWLD